VNFVANFVVNFVEYGIQMQIHGWGKFPHRMIRPERSRRGFAALGELRSKQGERTAHVQRVDAFLTT